MIATGNFGAPANGGEFAFVAGLAAVGAPTVVATVNPSIVVTGQTFKVTATITPGVGTMTNVSVDLTAIGGSSAATLVRSNRQCLDKYVHCSRAALPWPQT